MDITKALHAAVTAKLAKLGKQPLVAGLAHSHPVTDGDAAGHMPHEMARSLQLRAAAGYHHLTSRGDDVGKAEAAGSLSSAVAAQLSALGKRPLR